VLIRIADFACHCAANCGGWIDEGDPYGKIAAGGDRPTAYIHPGCADRYKRLLAANQTPVRNAPRRREPELVERECQRCGAAYAGPPEDVVDRCRAPGINGKPCDGPLVDIDADDRAFEVTTVDCADCRQPMRVRGRLQPEGPAPAWLRAAYDRYRPVCEDCALTASGSDDAREATSSARGADEQLALEEKAARTPGADRMRIPAPRVALGVAASPASDPVSRDDARNEPTPEGGR
jgi:hypothetical protein